MVKGKRVKGGKTDLASLVQMRSYPLWLYSSYSVQPNFCTLCTADTSQNKMQNKLSAVQCVHSTARLKSLSLLARAVSRRTHSPHGEDTPEAFPIVGKTCTGHFCLLYGSFH